MTKITLLLTVLLVSCVFDNDSASKGESETETIIQSGIYEASFTLEIYDTPVFFTMQYFISKNNNFHNYFITVFMEGELIMQNKGEYSIEDSQFKYINNLERTFDTGNPTSWHYDNLSPDDIRLIKTDRFDLFLIGDIEAGISSQWHTFKKI